MQHGETPVRDLGTLDPSGFRLLRETSLSYRDGGEEAVLRIVTEAEDLSSGTVDMVASATGWPQRYHVDPARANIVRCLDLPKDARVLEIGAGCGAITRYLGENCAVVDGLEPMTARATVARARTRDLPGVEIFVGELDDVPDVPAYDVIVVIGVLEYVGNGTADRGPYLDFLAGIRSRLVEGGTLVLAIENELGVKYLVGAPEDHTDRVFDSIEGYPRGGKARTFSRRALEQLVRDAGLSPTTRIAFPDYKLTRAVFGDFPDTARTLLYRIPRFPSPDWRTRRPRLADESAVWSRLVDAGLETEFGNSFLVLAGRDGDSTLWPADQAGVFYTTDRRPHFNTATVIKCVGDTVRFVRTVLVTGAPAPAGDIGVDDSDAEYSPGTDLTAVLAAGGIAAFAPLADKWLELVDTALAADPGAAIDVVPHNIVVGDDGQLHVIDVELTEREVTRERVLRRGVYWLAVRAAPLAAPERWQPATTVGDVMRALGSVVGLDPEGSWIEQVLTEEVVFLARVRPGPPAGMDADAWLRQIDARLRGNVSRRLADLPLGDRLPDQFKKVSADLKAARSETHRLKQELATYRQKLKQAEAAHRRLTASRAVQLAQRARRTVDPLLPRGSRRRDVLARVAGRKR